MISPELLRRYPFFAGLTMSQISTLAQAALEERYETNHFLFHEGDRLTHFYLLLEGAVGIALEVPARDVTHSISDQLAGTMKSDVIVVSTVGPGELFGWSAVLPPHEATSAGKVLANSRVVAFDGAELLQAFVDDPQFGYQMTQKLAGLVRQRLYDMRIESLAHTIA